MSDLPGIASLWIGPRLGWIEQLSLLSFVAKGHSVALYTYADVQDIPGSIEVRNARDVWDMPSRFLEDTGASYVADIFRVHLMEKTNLIWVDTDAFCLKPFTTSEEGYLVGHFHGRTDIANGVMRLPQQSGALSFLKSICEDPNFIPWWVRPALQQRIRNMEPSERLRGQFHLKRGILGPRALSAGLHKTGEEKHAVHERVLYPYSWEFADLPFSPYGGWEGSIAEDTISVHFYQSQIRNVHKKRFPPHPNSFMGQKIDELGFQLPH